MYTARNTVNVRCKRETNTVDMKSNQHGNYFKYSRNNKDIDVLIGKGDNEHSIRGLRYQIELIILCDVGWISYIDN